MIPSYVIFLRRGNTLWVFFYKFITVLQSRTVLLWDYECECVLLCVKMLRLWLLQFCGIWKAFSHKFLTFSDLRTTSCRTVHYVCYHW
jgi:hypothetical protein